MNKNTTKILLTFIILPLLHSDDFSLTEAALLQRRFRHYKTQQSLCTPYPPTAERPPNPGLGEYVSDAWIGLFGLV